MLRDIHEDLNEAARNVADAVVEIGRRVKAMDEAVAQRGADGLVNCMAEFAARIGALGVTTVRFSIGEQPDALVRFANAIGMQQRSTYVGPDATSEFWEVEVNGVTFEQTLRRPHTPEEAAEKAKGKKDAAVANA